MDALTDAEISRTAKRYTMTRHVRRQAMIDALRRVDRDGVEGDVVECGVWKGGNIIIARLTSPQRHCWLYDTFEGMTKPAAVDMNRRGYQAAVDYRAKRAAGEGWCAASMAEVIASMQLTGVYDEAKLSFVAGQVETTLAVTDNLPERIAVLRLDTDWYASTKVELDVLYPRLAPGGVLIVDDYGHWQGSRKAVDEYFQGQPFAPVWIDYSAITMVKPC